VSGSAKSEALAISLGLREALFREGVKPQMNAGGMKDYHRDFTRISWKPELFLLD